MGGDMMHLLQDVSWGSLYKLYLSSAPTCIFLFFYLLFTRFWLISVLYAVWWFFDYDTPARGGRRVHVLCGLKVWELMRDYFPIKVRSSFWDSCCTQPTLQYCICTSLPLSSPKVHGRWGGIYLRRSENRTSEHLPVHFIKSLNSSYIEAVALISVLDSKWTTDGWRPCVPYGHVYVSISTYCIACPNPTVKLSIVWLHTVLQASVTNKQYRLMD